MHTQPGDELVVVAWSPRGTHRYATILEIKGGRRTALSGPLVGHGGYGARLSHGGRLRPPASDRR